MMHNATGLQLRMMRLRLHQHCHRQYCRNLMKQATSTTTNNVSNVNNVNNVNMNNTISYGNTFNYRKSYSYYKNYSQQHKHTNNSNRELSSISLPFSTDSTSSINEAISNATDNDTTTTTGNSNANAASASTSANNDDIGTKLDELTNKQLHFLAYIEELESTPTGSPTPNHDNDNENTDSNTNNTTNNVNIKEKEYLNEIYKIANEMDNLLYRNYNTKLSSSSSSSSSSSYDMDLFNTVIDAWKVVMDAYNNSNNNIHTYADNDTTNINYLIPLGIPQRATRLLETMESHFINDNDDTIYNNNMNMSMNMNMNMNMNNTTGVPILSIDTYNNVLEIWSTSNEYNLNSRADSIFRRIKERFEESTSENDKISSTTAAAAAATTNNNTTIRPNADTLKIMIRAWCSISQSQSQSRSSWSSSNKENKVKGSAIFNATGFLIQMQDLLQSGERDFEPSLEDYLVVFRSWGEVTDKRHSARRVLNLLRKMESLNLDRYTEVKPNTEIYKYVLQTISNSKPKFFPNGGGKVNHILSQMETNSILPDSDCYSHAIKAWCVSSHNNESPQTQRFQDAIEGQLVLQQMEEMYYRSGSIVVRPTTADYNNVIRALSKCNIEGVVSRVEALLTKMEQKYHDGDVLLMPDSETYMDVITAWKNSTHVRNHVDGARSVFDRMVKQYQNGNHSCKPSVQGYNALISLCGSYNFIDADVEDKRKALECVVDTVNKMRKSEEVELNSMTYNLLLYAFGNLLEKGSREQIKAIESIFAKCCTEGLVDNKVLNAMQKVSSYDVYRRNVLNSATKDDNSDSDRKLHLPMKWSWKIVGERPLIRGSMDGDYLSQRNRELSERKMRRLRTRKNQHLLQGGRA